jgi:hypothetical protein
VPIEVSAKTEQEFGFFFENFQVSAEKYKAYVVTLKAAEALKAAAALKKKQSRFNDLGVVSDDEEDAVDVGVAEEQRVDAEAEVV